jgi:hypothetical protein
MAAFQGLQQLCCCWQSAVQRQQHSQYCDEPIFLPYLPQSTHGKRRRDGDQLYIRSIKLAAGVRDDSM